MKGVSLLCALAQKTSAFCARPDVSLAITPAGSARLADIYLVGMRTHAKLNKNGLAGKSLFWYLLQMSRLILSGFCLGLLIALAGCATAPSTVNVKDTSKSFTTVVIDAGHGGRDNGAYRRYGPPEKVVALDVAKRVEHKLHDADLRTVMTRSGDIFIPLDERVEIENRENNAVFVSIHFNDARRSGIKGFETYYHSPESAELARRIQSKLVTIPRSANRGVHVANFRVLRKANQPAVLVECGFLSNRSDGRQARDADYRELLADKIVEAVVEQRHGTAGYRPASRTVLEALPPSEGPGLAPSTLRGD
jgi:N-acetylmuramoyl-L-alanine amidase